MIGYRDCATFNLSNMECAIYKAIKSGVPRDAVRQQYGLTQNKFERVVASINKKISLSQEFKKRI